MKVKSKSAASVSSNKVSQSYKHSLRSFLSKNPFSSPLTLGFFYREKMKAIYKIAPDSAYQEILEVGGGKGGLTPLLYPKAQVTNIDIDPAFAEALSNQNKNVTFVCGDATQLPFECDSFDAVTMFDVLEHIPDHKKAISEAFRVLRSGGTLLISTPNENWRFPYYRAMQFVCPSDSDVMAEWGHVRRGYALSELTELIGLPCEQFCTFITPITVIGHDIAFSHFPFLARQLLSILVSPITWVGYLLHQPHDKGTETAYSWKKP
ncbi:class I SAM-dependent methyltransferase [Leptolyngbya sp. BC1307]|uniref:class I SAM-dependent methyltransferase n=1 Tax=Leptolyngbya sp. BC1307 TaxID=2029589 RepID=UPI000EFBA8BD|nr:class I SAM-dependent methyltransferase [Leptolyngbya sp. BC1307]